MGKNKKGPKKAPIFEAAERGDLQALIECLKEDASSRDSRNRDGWTPLHQAAYSGQQKIVSALIKAGAKINDKDNDGDTPLHYASAQNQSDCITVLAKSGADMEARDKDGESPMDVAANGKVKQLLKKLLEESHISAEGGEQDEDEWEELEGDEAEKELAKLEIKK
ncbi:hypothetical protein CYMTET_21463 [Cymbomonas tetramitiformis]|uniref:Uncharacterized protein n=1 Tax=Cymbomonas tetramitiformis TaxID=36881 RepID=A0AAE0L2Y0_9CHLO|nr:hypothetical protein CYMTET_21463 [Cymbomonas tetramitiformis]